MLVNAYSTLVKPQPDPGCALGEVRRRGLRTEAGEVEPELAEHLRGLAGYAFEVAGGVMTAASYAVQQHVRQVLWHYLFEWDPHQPEALTQWSRQANAILYLPGGNLVDPDGQSLVAAGADGMPPGRVPCRADAVARADAVRQELAAQGVVVAASLPPCRGVGEVLTQPAHQVGLRILGLALVADFSQSVLAGAPVHPEHMWHVYPRAMSAFSAEEDRLFRTADRDAAYQLSWRSEAADILLWATGRAPLVYPRAQRDPRDTFATVFAGSEEQFLAETTLRPLHELLGEQERTRSLMWALRQHQHFGGPAVRGVDEGVVMERLVALNWLLDWRAGSWDETDTAT